MPGHNGYNRQLSKGKNISMETAEKDSFLDLGGGGAKKTILSDQVQISMVL